MIGASSDPRRFGGRPIQYLLEAGFDGPVYPVNPGRAEIQGLKAYPSIRDLPEPVVIYAEDDEPAPVIDPEGHVDLEEELVWTSESSGAPASE